MNENYENLPEIESEPRMVRMPKKFLEELGIEYTYELEEDGAHFVLKPSPEELLNIRENFSSLSGAMVTDFDRNKLMPFLNRIKETAGINYRKVIIGNNYESVEVIVYRDKNKRIYHK